MEGQTNTAADVPQAVEQNNEVEQLKYQIRKLEAEVKEQQERKQFAYKMINEERFKVDVLKLVLGKIEPNSYMTGSDFIKKMLGIVTG